MDVKAILDAVCKLASGLDIPTDITLEVALIYLNLAHCDLYRRVYASNLPAFLKKEEIKIGESLPDVLFVDSVFIKTPERKLSKVFWQDVVKGDPLLKKVGHPFNWTWRESGNKWTFFVYPSLSLDKPQEILVFYVPQPQNLLMDDREDQIPYPSLWHNLLIDGAIYYMAQGDGGLSASASSQIYMKRWEYGLSEFLKNRQANKMRSVSTFRNV